MSDTPPLCELCDRNDATIACSACDMDELCSACDADVHKSAKAAAHRRTLIATGEALVSSPGSSSGGDSGGSPSPSAATSAAAGISPMLMSPQARMSIKPRASINLLAAARPPRSSPHHGASLGSIEEHGAGPSYSPPPPLSSAAGDAVPPASHDEKGDSDATLAADAPFVKLCDDCSAVSAAHYCSACQRFACTACDHNLHKSSAMKGHVRMPYPPVFGKPANSSAAAAAGPDPVPVSAVPAPSPTARISPGLAALSQNRGPLSPGGARNARSNSVMMMPAGRPFQLSVLPTISSGGSGVGGTDGTASAAGTPQRRPTVTNAPTCDICEDSRASVRCDECKMNLCISNACDEELHAPAKMRHHVRNPLNAISFTKGVTSPALPNSFQQSPGPRVSIAPQAASLVAEPAVASEITAAAPAVSISVTIPPSPVHATIAPSPLAASTAASPAAVAASPNSIAQAAAAGVREDLLRSAGLGAGRDGPRVSLTNGQQRNRASSVMIKSSPIGGGNKGSVSNSFLPKGPALVAPSPVNRASAEEELTARTARGSRLCEICEAQPAAVYCAACPMYVCLVGGCDKQLHAPLKLAHHLRTRLPAPPCSICEENEGTQWCFDCKKHYCTADGCDAGYHAPAKMSGHRRQGVKELHQNDASAAAAGPSVAATAAALAAASDVVSPPSLAITVTPSPSTPIAAAVSELAPSLALDFASPLPAATAQPLPTSPQFASVMSSPLAMKLGIGRAPSLEMLARGRERLVPARPIAVALSLETLARARANLVPTASLLAAPRALGSARALLASPGSAVASIAQPVVAASPAAAPAAAATVVAPVVAPAAPAPESFNDAKEVMSAFFAKRKKAHAFASLAQSLVASTTPLAPARSGFFVLCDACDSSMATLVCSSCKDESATTSFFCHGCDGERHKHDGARGNHKRRAITKKDTLAEPETPATAASEPATVAMSTVVSTSVPTTNPVTPITVAATGTHTRGHSRGVSLSQWPLGLVAPIVSDSLASSAAQSRRPSSGNQHPTELLPFLPTCDRCSLHKAAIYCEDCELNLDNACFGELHKSTASKSHPRKYLVDESVAAPAQIVAAAASVAAAVKKDFMPSPAVAAVVAAVVEPVVVPAPVVVAPVVVPAKVEETKEAPPAAPAVAVIEPAAAKPAPAAPAVEVKPVSADASAASKPTKTKSSIVSIPKLKLDAPALVAAAAAAPLHPSALLPVPISARSDSEVDEGEDAGETLKRKQPEASPVVVAAPPPAAVALLEPAVEPTPTQTKKKSEKKKKPAAGKKRASVVASSDAQSGQPATTAPATSEPAVVEPAPAVAAAPEAPADVSLPFVSDDTQVERLLAHRKDRPARAPAAAVAEAPPAQVALVQLEKSLLNRVASLEHDLQESVQLKSARIHSARQQAGEEEPSALAQPPVACQGDSAIDTPAAMAAIRKELADARAQLAQFQQLAATTALQLQMQQQATSLAQQQQQVMAAGGGAGMMNQMGPFWPLLMAAMASSFPGMAAAMMPAAMQSPSPQPSAPVQAPVASSNIPSTGSISSMPEPFQRELQELISSTIQTTLANSPSHSRSNTTLAATEEKEQSQQQQAMRTRSPASRKQARKDARASSPDASAAGGRLSRSTTPVRDSPLSPHVTAVQVAAQKRERDAARVKAARDAASSAQAVALQRKPTPAYRNNQILLVPNVRGKDETSWAVSSDSDEDQAFPAHAQSTSGSSPARKTAAVPAQPALPHVENDAVIFLSPTSKPDSRQRHRSPSSRPSTAGADTTVHSTYTTARSSSLSDEERNGDTSSDYEDPLEVSIEESLSAATAALIARYRQEAIGAMRNATTPLPQTHAWTVHGAHGGVKLQPLPSSTMQASPAKAATLSAAPSTASLPADSPASSPAPAVSLSHSASHPAMLLMSPSPAQQQESPARVRSPSSARRRAREARRQHALEQQLAHEKKQHAEVASRHQLLQEEVHTLQRAEEERHLRSHRLVDVAAHPTATPRTLAKLLHAQIYASSAEVMPWRDDAVARSHHAARIAHADQYADDAAAELSHGRTLGRSSSEMHLRAHGESAAAQGHTFLTAKQQRVFASSSELFQRGLLQQQHLLGLHPAQTASLEAHMRSTQQHGVDDSRASLSYSSSAGALRHDGKVRARSAHMRAPGASHQSASQAVASPVRALPRSASAAALRMAVRADAAAAATKQAEQRQRAASGGHAAGWM